MCNRAQHHHHHAYGHAGADAADGVVHAAGCCLAVAADLTHWPLQLPLLPPLLLLLPALLQLRAHTPAPAGRQSLR
jgi:hypothetical protein